MYICSWWQQIPWSYGHRNLSWPKHVSDTAGKAHRSLGFLQRNFKHCSRQVKAATYTSVFRPVREDAVPVWDPYRQDDINHLNKSSAGQLAMCTMTIHPLHLDASQRWQTSLVEKAFRTDARSPLQSTSWFSGHRQGNLLKTRWQPHKNPHRILARTQCAWGLSQLLLPQNKNSKWVWSGNTTITNRRQHRGTTRKSRSTITRHQEDKFSKATSSLFPIKMIAILEWT